MIYEVWYKNGVDLDYFSSREAAEMYLEKYIAKLTSSPLLVHSAILWPFFGVRIRTHSLTVWPEAAKSISRWNLHIELDVAARS